MRYLDRPEMDKILSLCKRRRFVFQSSEIYGGLGSTWDYGPLGVELKRNLKDLWWRTNVYERDDVVGLDAAILMHPQVWVSSGHVENFTDPLVECKRCHQRFRQDEIQTVIGEPAKAYDCPNCGGQLSDPRKFNLMFKTFMGPAEDTAHEIYLRPETAQGIFANFSNVLMASRRKLPFGIAQIGKAFRNEITPGNFTFRTREFEQMEIEYFVKPGTDEDWLQIWLASRFDWYIKYGMRRENLRLRMHEAHELAHYAKETYDIEYHFPWGWGELEGVANRADFDLRSHAAGSGEDLTYFDEATKGRYFPYVIEPSGGVDRAALAFLLDSYDEEPDRSPTVQTNKEIASQGTRDYRVVLHLHPRLAPVKVAVLPLSRNEKLTPLASQVYQLTRSCGFATQFDDAQSIGRRYRRQDEIGTPYCVTVDFDSLDDNCVTIRDRESMDQVRVPIVDLVATLIEKLGKGW